MIDIRDRKVYIFVGFMLLVILFFSSASVSVKSSSNSVSNSLNNNSVKSEKPVVKEQPKFKNASEKLAKDLNMYGLPEQDEYMSQTLRSQLQNLETKFYYDNCRYEPL